MARRPLDPEAVVLSKPALDRAIAQADEALRAPTATRVKSALAALSGVETWGELLADIAEAGRAGSLAATRALAAWARAAGDTTEVQRLAERALDQGDVYAAFQRARDLAGQAARRGEAFALLLRIARALGATPTGSVAEKTCVVAATRCLCMMEIDLVETDRAVADELRAAVAPHHARFAREIAATRKEHGLR